MDTIPDIQTSQLYIPDQVIDFGAGFPSPSLLPKAMMAQAAAHRLAQEDAQLLQYGAEMGDGHLRISLADFLARHYQIPVSPSELFITAGSSYTLDLICQHYTQPGDTIFVEEPTYIYALGIFRDYDLNVISIPMDEQGLILDMLQVQLAQVTPRFVYTIPTFHNPSAVTLSTDRREALVALSEVHQFKIVADEVYHLLNYTETPPPPPMFSLDRAETVISVGSFSKILAPGVRLGWIQTAPPVAAQLYDRGFLISGGGFNPFTSSLVHTAINLGLQDDHLSHLKDIYRLRSHYLMDLLREHIPALRFETVNGGFFLWAELPHNLSAGRLLKHAEAHNIHFHSGASFSSQNGLDNHLRLSFAYYEDDKLEAGVKGLAKAYTRDRSNVIHQTVG
ncbi:MAG: PLP-dependent aminotransferase family protein [Chloroflexota bacterium]